MMTCGKLVLKTHKETDGTSQLKYKVKLCKIKIKLKYLKKKKT